MTAPTHIAFAMCCGFIGGAPETSLGLLAAGALLPDLDHPQSAMGRIFFFLSMPLNKFLGHRRSWHGFPLWGLVTALGLVWGPFWFLGAGALSHVFLDCLNVSGVQALEPFSERICVLFDRKFRITTGSQAELALLVLFGTFAWAGHYVGTIGGLRSLIGAVTGSPKMAFEQYRRKGTEICYLDGKLRWKNGKIEKGKWQIVGLEGFRGIAIWNGKKILHLPFDAEFLSCRLSCTGQHFEAATINGWAKTKTPAYFFDGKAWRYSQPGGVIFGQVIAKKINLEVLDVIGEDHL